MTIYDTAKDIVNVVAGDLGLGTSVSPFSSGEPNIVQMCSLLGTAGQEMIQFADFQQLRRQGTFTTDELNTDGEYELGDDFLSLIPNTMWDTTSIWPVDGSMSAQNWSYQTAFGSQIVTIYMSFRVMQQKIRVLPLPNPDGLEVIFDYMSNAPFQAVNFGVYKRRPTRDDDDVLIDPALIQAYLKVKWLEAKGFATASSAKTLEMLFNSRVGKDVPGRVLSLTRRAQFPYVSVANVADNGYGS